MENSFDPIMLAATLPTPPNMESHAGAIAATALPSATSSMLPPAKPRKRKAPTLRDSDWEPHRARITELYTSKTPLKVVKETIETETGFTAELRQYKSRISLWKLHRNVKTDEMNCIVRKRQRRKLVETHKPALEFEVRGTKVDEAKIDRWMNSHGMSDRMVYSPSIAASTPSAIGCHTISERGSPAPSSSRISDLPLSVPEFDWYRNLSQVRQSWNELSRFDRNTPTFSDQLDICKRESSAYLQRHLIIDRGESHLPDPVLLPYLCRLHSWVEREVPDLWLQCCTEIGISLERTTGIQNQTPLLHVASEVTNYLPLPLLYMKALIKYGANVHAVDSKGRGALAVVLCNSHVYPSWWYVNPTSFFVEQAFIVLLEAGCDPNHMDNAGKTPTDHAKDVPQVLDDWTSALKRTVGRLVLLKFEEELGIDGALNRLLLRTPSLGLSAAHTRPVYRIKSRQ